MNRVLRPRPAARMRRLRFKVSSGLRIVMKAMMPSIGRLRYHALTAVQSCETVQRGSTGPWSPVYSQKGSQSLSIRRASPASRGMSSGKNRQTGLKADAFRPCFGSAAVAGGLARRPEPGRSQKTDLPENAFNLQRLPRRHAARLRRPPVRCPRRARRTQRSCCPHHGRYQPGRDRQSRCARTSPARSPPRSCQSRYRSPESPRSGPAGCPRPS